MDTLSSNANGSGGAGLPLVSQEFDFEDSDITLKSSDGVLFKVHVCRLAGASPVFQDMFAQVKNMDKGDGLNSVITLTDEAIEYTAPVDILLRTIYGRELPILTSFTRADYRAAVRILQKYNCSAAMQMLRYSLYASAEAPGHCKVGIFTIASYLDEVRVCSNMLLASGRHRWWELDQFGRPFSEQPDITERPIECKSLFDLAALPRSMAQNVPWEYNFALTRAQTIHRGGDLHRADWEAIVKDFEAHLKIVNPSVRGKSMAGDS